MKLHRTYQLELLRTLAESYPQCHDISQQLKGMNEEAEARYQANIVYLDEQGLVESGIQFGADGHASYGLPRINHKGMDFLADDGGLSAILGVVTIKFHDETLKALVAQKIEKSELTPADKGLWLEALRKLPAETTKHLAVKLMDLGLAHTPDVLRQVGALIGFPQ